MHARLVALGIAGGVAAVVCPGSIAAQPAETPADVLFQEGRDLMTAGKYAEACDAFDASQELKPDTGTLVNQANCREKNGQLASAWGLFVDAERQTRAAADEPTRKLHQTVADRAAALEARCSTLTIKVPDRRIHGLEILRNGKQVDSSAWNKAVPVDGGTHAITARAPGAPGWSITVTVGGERDRQTIEVPKLMAPALVPAPARTRAPPGEPAPAVHYRSIIPLALAGGSVVLLGGAAGFARWGDRTYAKAKSGTDPATQLSLWRSANQKRYAAEAMLGAGIGCAGVAVWLWLRGRAESPPAAVARKRDVTIAPLVNADMVGAGFGGRW